jgi:hypothetical protein
MSSGNQQRQFVSKVERSGISSGISEVRLDVGRIFPARDTTSV